VQKRTYRRQLRRCRREILLRDHDAPDLDRVILFDRRDPRSVRFAPFDLTIEDQDRRCVT
jgi:hypothetical protein